MKKIAIFQTDLNVGGIQKSIINLLNNIDKENNMIDLYLVDYKDEYKMLFKNVNIKKVKKLPYFTRLIFFSILKRFYKFNCEEEYDIAIDFNSYSNETAISAIKCNSKKKIMWIHNDVEIKIKEEFKYKVLHFFFKNKYKYFDEFVAVSSGCLESFKKVNRINDKKYEVIPNLIDTVEIDLKKNDEVNINIDMEKINICSVGRLVHQKGFDILLNNINNIKDKLNNHHFYIIGGGKDEKLLESLIKKYNLSDLVTITGYSKNPYAIMNKCDGFVLTSRYEGQGMVFLEAYYLGLQIVMPKHLEKYVDLIKGTNDVEDNILNIKKIDKKNNSLDKYNNEIIKKFNNL